MSSREAFFLIFSILGGVAIFILGMSIMTDGLKQAAGDRLRVILSKATGNRYTGVAFGTTLGLMVHSSAATVMMVGFINAGLMRLINAIPLLMGASIGTTLSMQLISFRLTDYAMAAVAVGFLLQMFVPKPLVKNIGKTLLGFGLLFMGLAFLSESIQPYREDIAPWLTRIDGSTWSGMFWGILVATSVTLIIQSSGAVIGMLFAMIGAGMFTSVEQFYPIVLGAHIGTAVTAFLVSIGTNSEARKAAWANFFFQVFNVLLAVAAAPLFIWLINQVSGDLVRQAANLHTLTMVAATAILLPFIPACVRFVDKVAPVKGEAPQLSFLERNLLPTPERAICSTLRELRRAMDICEESFRLFGDLYQDEDRQKAKRLRLNEEAVDEIKSAMKVYLAQLTRGYLSRRQALMVQYLSQIMNDVERIGDHIKSLYVIRCKQRENKNADLDPATAERFRLIQSEVRKVLHAVADSLSPETVDFAASGDTIIDLRDNYDELSHSVKSEVNGRVAAHDLHPIIGLFFSEYLSAFDRIVKHCKMIAREQQQPFFRIKTAKMEKMVERQ
jgi:phosphate:Na+ symporter